MHFHLKEKQSLVWLVALSALLVTSCTKFVAEKNFIHSVGAAKLKAYANDMQRNEVWNALKGQPAPKSIWLPSFATNGVLQVKPYLSGVLFVLETQGRMERGVYVLTDKAEAPEDGSGINFARIQSRMYWFEQKVRDRYIPLEQRNPASR
jgi:hypothetical protein